MLDGLFKEHKNDDERWIDALKFASITVGGTGIVG